MTASRSCRGKRRLTREEARRQAAWFRHARMARMRSYKCRRCGGYHIGHVGSGRRKRW